MYVIADSALFFFNIKDTHLLVLDFSASVELLREMTLANYNNYLLMNFSSQKVIHVIDLMQQFLNRAHLFLKRGAGDLIFTTCDCYGLNNVVFNFGAHSYLISCLQKSSSNFIPMRG